MLRENNGTAEAYAEALQNLKPLLNEIAKTTRVIWFNTYTSNALTKAHDRSCKMKLNQLNPTKIYGYNQVVQRILK